MLKVSIIISLFLLLIFQVPFKNIKENRCSTWKEFTVRGTSMQPLLKEEDVVEVLLGHYTCNNIEREDIVFLTHTGNGNPIIKKVRAIPKDEFSLVKNLEGRWYIKINNDILVNSSGEKYEITKENTHVLGLYQESYNNQIPEGAYLVLGEDTAGTYDSIVFGLIGKDYFAGKVIQ